MEPISQLGMIVPDNEKQFNRLWTAMGRSLWMNHSGQYTGSDGQNFKDRRIDGNTYRLISTIDKVS